MPEFSERTASIPATDGFPLGALVLEPAAPRAVLQLQGGTGIPRGLYLKFARYAAERGYVVVLSDYRGLGASRPARLRGFETALRHWGERDMPGVLAWIRQQYPALPVVLLGHSAGAQQVGLMPNHAELRAVAAVAAGSGYWRELASPYRYFSLFIWYLAVPLTVPLLGYFPARLFRLGEDLPRGVVLEWRDWCLHDPYLGAQIGETIRAPHYAEVRTPIRTWAMTDDPIAHPASTAALFRLYPNAPIEHVTVRPEEVGQPIGHAGFFSSRFRDSLWPQPLDWFDEKLGGASA